MDSAGNRYRMEVSGFLIRAGLVLGTVLLFPSLLYAIRSGKTALVVADGSAYAAFLSLYLLNRWKPRLSAGGLVGLVFGFGCYLLAANGPAAAGTIWMGAAVVLAAVLFGTAGGVLGAALVGAAFLAVTFAASRGLPTWSAPSAFLVILGLNAVVMSLAAGLAASYVARSLERALAERERLSRQLAERSAALEREAAERLGAERKAEFYRDFDGRTGLPNRERFLRELERTLVPASRRGRPLSVLAVGIHRPGLIFDEFGHVQGEAAIAGAAARLREAFREDDVVARFGDALFFVLCSDLGSPDDIAELLPKAFSAFERPVEAGSHLIHVAAVVGVALYPHDGDTPDELVRAATAAYHHAEEDGPGAYRVFDASLHADLIERLRFERDLAGAVRDGALVPWFQPKVDGRGAVVGAEALARWPRPDGSLGMPSDFIPVAERAGLMEALGRDILRKSCRRAREWNAGASGPASVAVNLSPQALRKPAIAEEVWKALEETGLDPALLELEITETGLALAAEAAVPRLRELKSLGVSLAIDDFGTGASGISRLRDFPVDFVKLPLDLVEPLPSDRRSRAIVKAVIDLAHALGFRVVAEGVESAGQLEWLGEASCDLFQGFLFAPPLPADRFRSALGEGYSKVLGNG
ncbi:MAG TPA: EAL domain-containing protein [Spirochaetia bacterium]|nr:EAL domain-containing protein [Spirochaetales bacterium]HRY79650.1 EAL domain-containing protein [Spirochaetia bacterium]